MLFYGGMFLQFCVLKTAGIWWNEIPLFCFSIVSPLVHSAYRKDSCTHTNSGDQTPTSADDSIKGTLKCSTRKRETPNHTSSGKFLWMNWDTASCIGDEEHRRFTKRLWKVGFQNTRPAISLGSTVFLGRRTRYRHHNLDKKRKVLSIYLDLSKAKTV